MILRGKPYNEAIMAVARELAGFIWEWKQEEYRRCKKTLSSKLNNL